MHNPPGVQEIVSSRDDNLIGVNDGCGDSASLDMTGDTCGMICDGCCEAALDEEDAEAAA